jgi:hypothetical protein
VLLYLIVVVIWQFRFEALSHKDTGLVSPSSGNVTHSIATAAKNQGRQIKALDEVDAVGMSSHAQIEAAKTITRQTVTTTLEDHSLWAIPLHHALDDGLEDALVRDIIDTIAEREIDRVVLALPNTDVAKFTSTGEVLAVFVERDGHNAISRVESFFNAIAVVNIDINVKDSLFEP